MIEFYTPNSVFERAITIKNIESINVVEIIRKSNFSKIDSILYDSLGVKHSSWSYEYEHRIRGKILSFKKYNSETIDIFNLY